MAKNKDSDYINTLFERNAKTLAEIVVDPVTPEHTRIQVLNRLLESQEKTDFFSILYQMALSYGECPHCKHANHWLIPEDELNQRGYVSHQRDPRVHIHTDDRTCEIFKEACLKKKITT